MTVILEPKESQDLYDFILGKRKPRLPETKKIKEGAILTAEQLEEVYNIVANNRAKTRGTKLYFEVNQDGDVSKIDFETVKIPSEPIVTPRPKDKREIKQSDNKDE